MKTKGRIIIGAAALAIFILITVMVVSAGGAPLGIDNKIQNSVFGLREFNIASLLTAITYLSDPKFIIGLLVILLIIPKIRVKVGVPVAISEGVAFAIYSALKIIIARPRPDVSLRLVGASGFSFPSGHSISSMVVYGLLIYLIRKYCKSEKVKNALTVTLGILIPLIGFSRIYVGVHWPTDVFAGWCFGILMLCLSIGIQKRIERKKEINNESI